MSSRSRAAVVRLLVGATLISFSPIFVKLAHVGPTTAGFYRLFFGGLFLVVLVIARRETVWKGLTPLFLALAAAAFFVADLNFWHRSIFYVGPGLATILGNFQVFFLAAFGIVVVRERADWRFLVSLPLAIAGLFMVVGVDWSQLEAGYRRGLLFGVLTAVMYAGYLLVLHASQSRTPRLSSTANLAIITLVGAVIMGMETAAFGESFRIPDRQSWFALLGYGVGCQAVGWIIISRALRDIEASRAGLILLLQPTLAFVWDVLFFSRPTDGIGVLGAGVTLAAIYLGSTRRTARLEGELC
jgi:drug/metabolite transporter (DMT)-like permease